ncbi:uncharacterized protein F4817DRAFT_127696 [Daldinia loculata]|uniref:uncharacterized protein n=1 Tax=Daldinia loculata TaxID=103429 RepID=UPI0020C2DAFE|nr:uncharacterized protein F4817DRAFT_127696 [Daldinia loculata]KAI1646653.1 hypothetical protein F4817DRAFT_127696 [Daldinia loculata]
MWSNLIASVVAVLLFTVGGFADPCRGVPPARYPFKLAEGWIAKKVGDGLSSPRGMVIDSADRLLIVEKGVGISQHKLDIDGCIYSSRTLIPMPDLNHGIYLGIDGNTLYASSTTTVFRWSYNSETGDINGEPTTVISGMSPNNHVTRTLIIPPHCPDLLVVSHGSTGNVDYAAVDPGIARATVKVFNISAPPNGGYNYVKDGWRAGYGLRNEVGLVFDGNNMLWGVENSADQLTRDINGTSTDIHNDNPAEELNFLGDVMTPNDNWYGYPTCFTVWQPEAAITNATSGNQLDVGQQFVLAPNQTFDDNTCARMSTPPRLTFEAHTAPLDAKFDAPKYTNLFVTLHGSWDRNPPAGYKLVAVPFQRDAANGGAYAPVAPANCKTGYVDIFYPPDEGKCSSSSCARPVGLVFDEAGQLYMSSDTSGEVFKLYNP